jgi:hypothetical protein
LFGSTVYKIGLPTNYLHIGLAVPVQKKIANDVLTYAYLTARNG